MNIQELYESIGSDYQTVLARFGNQEHLMARFVKTFPNDPTYQNLAESADTMDYTGIENHAHTLKGVSGNLGFDRLFNACSEVVSCIRQKRYNDFPESYKNLKQEYESIINAINMMNQENG